jgi:hypothetical protein
MLNSHISHQVYPALLLGVSVGYCQRALVGESGMIITLTGKHNILVTVAMYEMHGAIPPSKQTVTPFICVEDLTERLHSRC